MLQYARAAFFEKSDPSFPSAVGDKEFTDSHRGLVGIRLEVIEFGSGLADRFPMSYSHEREESKYENENHAGDRGDYGHGTRSFRICVHSV